jgi:hypothetical protein
MFRMSVGCIIQTFCKEGGLPDPSVRGGEGSRNPVRESRKGAHFRATSFFSTLVSTRLLEGLNVFTHCTDCTKEMDT